MRRAAKVVDFEPVVLTIATKPTTKKNSQRVWNGIPHPSAEFEAYQAKALWLLKGQYLGPPIDQPCHVSARFYRDARADVDNLAVALLDVLQKAKVLKNDRCVRSLSATKSDGCDGNPRVEVFITPYRVAA